MIASPVTFGDACGWLGLTFGGVVVVVVVELSELLLPQAANVNAAKVVTLNFAICLENNIIMILLRLKVSKIIIF